MAGKKKTEKTETTVAPIEAIAGEFSAEVTVSKDDRTTTTTIKVVCGASEGRFDIGGQTISAVRSFLTDALNIGSDADALVNGAAPEGGESYVLKAGDTLEFVKQSGRKG